MGIVNISGLGFHRCVHQCWSASEKNLKDMDYTDWGGIIHPRPPDAWLGLTVSFRKCQKWTVVAFRNSLKWTIVAFRKLKIIGISAAYAELISCCSPDTFYLDSIRQLRIDMTQVSLENANETSIFLNGYDISLYCYPLTITPDFVFVVSTKL